MKPLGEDAEVDRKAVLDLALKHPTGQSLHESDCCCPIPDTTPRFTAAHLTGWKPRAEAGQHLTGFSNKLVRMLAPFASGD